MATWLLLWRPPPIAPLTDSRGVRVQDVPSAAF